jgi:hypothetical protein
MKHKSHLPLNHIMSDSKTLGFCLNIITNTGFGIYIYIILSLIGGLENTGKVKLSL